jgi:acyl-coenzyme A synthetase/AMP-(fatty) acid ligase
LFSALLNGATILPYDIKLNGLTNLDCWVQRQRVTIIHSVPSIFRQLRAAPGSYPDVRLVRLEGDRVRPADIEHFRKYFDPHCVLVNGLGATECGLVRQYFIDHKMPMPSNNVPIGYLMYIITASRITSGELLK